jgi:hypothetical protein
VASDWRCCVSTKHRGWCRLEDWGIGSTRTAIASEAEESPTLTIRLCVQELSCPHISTNMCTGPTNPGAPTWPKNMFCRWASRDCSSNTAQVTLLLCSGIRYGRDWAGFIWSEWVLVFGTGPSPAAPSCLLIRHMPRCPFFSSLIWYTLLSFTNRLDVKTEVLNLNRRKMCVKWFSFHKNLQFLSKTTQGEEPCGM